MPPRAWTWARRITYGSERTAPLDFGRELWNWDVSRYESADGIASALTRAGEPSDDDSILYHATSTLLRDVVAAAGGVERSHIGLHEANVRIQESGSAWLARSDGFTGVAVLSDPSIEDAWYALEELLVWARTLDERLCRGRYRKQGLIPALADGPRRKSVDHARSRLLDAGVSEARYLGNLNLHMQSAYGGSPAGRFRGEAVVLPFPDRVSERISHRWQLTYADGRDGVSFADSVMDAVATFMDEMLDAFELHVPGRFKSP